ncbi:MAG: FtsK/SpoIIIE domain-containing protein, partial [Actinomycetota bacterium]
IIISLLLKTKPYEVKFIMIDPKMVELSIYNGVPHLLAPVVINPKKASIALSWAVDEMENRLKILSDYNCKNLEQFNKEVAKNRQRDPDLIKLPYILVFIDELADLMIVSASEVEESINRIAQMGRAVGIHLIIATQRPSVNVITGVIKANIPSRIAFNVASNTDSRVILDIPGAEKLIGRGDMLYSPVSFSRPERIQGSFVTSGEIELITDYIKDQKNSANLKDIFETEIKIEKKEMADDALIYEALEVFLEFGHASASLLQRRLRIGYSRAARIVDQLENRGFISGYDGAKPREVIISRDDFSKFKKDMGMDEN